MINDTYLTIEISWVCSSIFQCTVQFQQIISDYECVFILLTITIFMKGDVDLIEALDRI